ncbi:MAG: hypothetical protein LIO41_06015 [Ruminococcus sp.]|nr:hypothetical protein [Ruminococcus sp.]
MINLWIKLFGKSEFLGLNMGFWVSIAIVTLIVVAMNIVLWKIKPKEK